MYAGFAGKWEKQCGRQHRSFCFALYPAEGQNNAITRARKSLFTGWNGTLLGKSMIKELKDNSTTTKKRQPFRLFDTEKMKHLSLNSHKSLTCFTHLLPGKRSKRSPYYACGGSFLFEIAINRNYKCQGFHGACALFHRTNVIHPTRTRPSLFVLQRTRVFDVTNVVGRDPKHLRKPRCALLRTFGKTRWFSAGVRVVLLWRHSDWQFVYVYRSSQASSAHLAFWKLIGSLTLWALHRVTNERVIGNIQIHFTADLNNNKIKSCFIVLSVLANESVWSLEILRKSDWKSTVSERERLRKTVRR